MANESEDVQRQRNLEGRYANYYEIGHNEMEFILDFGQLYPEAKEPVFHTRITIVPALAKEFLETLEKSIRQYESTFGVGAREE